MRKDNILMRRLKVILEIEGYKFRRKYFLKQQQADVYVLLEQKMIQLHKKFLTDSQYFMGEFEKEGRKICVLGQDFNVKQTLTFFKVLGCLYGLQCCFERTWEVLSIYQMVCFLQINILKRMIEKDFRKNFDEYGFFILFSLAEKFNIEWLRTICIEQLLFLGFQQLNYNRYDLLLCEKSLVIKIIGLYQQFLQIGVTKLISKINLKKVIKQYCKQNNIHIQVDQILYKSVKEVIIETDLQYKDDDKMNNKDFNEKLTFSSSNTQVSLMKQNLIEEYSDKQQQHLINIPCLKKDKKQDELQEDREIIYSNEQIKMKSKQDTEDKNSRWIGFGDFSKVIEAQFLQETNINRDTNKCKKISNSSQVEKRGNRSISPPSSPNTPQFGEYLKITTNQHSNKNITRKFKRYITFSSSHFQQWN